MANNNAAQGLLDFQGNVGGATPTSNLITAKILYSDTNKIFTGDPVMRLASGYVGAWVAGNAVSQLIGVFKGCEYLSASQKRPVWLDYWPGADVVANSVVTAFISPCNLAVPGVFRVQSSGTAIAFADIGLNADFVMNAGNTATGRSAVTINQASLAVTATFPVRIIGLYSDFAPPGADGADDTTPFNWAIVAANVSGAGSTGI